MRTALGSPAGLKVRKNKMIKKSRVFNSICLVLLLNVIRNILAKSYNAKVYPGNILIYLKQQFALSFESNKDIVEM